ncbi:MAG: hypothetical protein K2P01_03630 [Oscillospiraceae bacterium]|nr:hypothetical protein [Oscillospiraceae bacterium]
MKRYQTFMDGVKAPDTLHQRLVELKQPGGRPAAWKKYATAAALALVVGLSGYGAWTAHINSRRAPLPSYPSGYQGVYPEVGGVSEPDIALVEPGDAAGTGRRTLGGYEVAEGGMAAYYVLPYIDYGEVEGAEMALDWDVPPGSVKRDLTREDIAALLGGEDALTTHLDWGGYELTGWAAWCEDGSFWGAYVQGHGGELDHFELTVTAGQMPPTCIAYPGSVEQEINGVTVTADKHDGAYGCSRRVSFMKDEYGCRFDLTGTDRERAEERVSRLVRQIVDGGVEADRLSSDGAVLAHPWEADPNTGVGESNWNDSGEGWTCPDCGVYLEAGVEHYHTQDGSPRDRGENWCGTQGADTETYPSCSSTLGKAVPEGDSFLTCRTCGGGIPDKTWHHCKPDGSGGHVCGVCGESFPEGKVHSHEVCVLPLAPNTQTCPDCGETYPEGTAHDCTMCSGYPAPYVCEVCGEALPAGMEHSHQENHHQNHH